MKRTMMGVAAVVLLLAAADTASARPWRTYYGTNYGYYNPAPAYGYSYGAAYSNNGIVTVGYASGINNGFGYGYGQTYGYSYPATGYRYSTPVYAVPPVYYGNYPAYGYGWGRRGWR